LKKKASNLEKERWEIKSGGERDYLKKKQRDV